MFTVNNKKSYKCKSKKSYKLESPDAVPDLRSVYLDTRGFRAQAFLFKNETSGAFDSCMCLLKD